MHRFTRRLMAAATVGYTAAAIAATAAGAEGEPPPAPMAPGTVVNNARLWVMGMLAGLASFYFILGAARYVMAGGDPGQVERAKQALKSALIGYASALLAPVVLAVLRGILGG
jgi:hypothetical protein